MGTQHAGRAMGLSVWRAQRGQRGEHQLREQRQAAGRHGVHHGLQHEQQLTRVVQRGRRAACQAGRQRGRQRSRLWVAAGLLCQ